MIRRIYPQGNLYTFADAMPTQPSDGMKPLDFYLFVRGIWQRASLKANTVRVASDIVTQSSIRSLVSKVADVFGYETAADVIGGGDTGAPLANLSKLGSDIDAWGTTKMQWAIAGRTPEGVPYDWRKWYATGAMYAEAAAFHAQEAINSSYLNASIEAALKTVGDVKKVGSTGLKVGLPLVALGAGVAAVLYLGSFFPKRR